MSSQITLPDTEAAILSRVIQAEDENLSRGAAEYLLSIRFGDQDIAGMNELSESARQATLTTQEQAELDSYLHFSNLLAVMQSKGRRVLRAPLGIESGFHPPRLVTCWAGDVNTVNSPQHFIQRPSK